MRSWRLVGTGKRLDAELRSARYAPYFWLQVQNVHPIALTPVADLVAADGLDDQRWRLPNLKPAFTDALLR
jgi:hypothetical protein